MKRKGNNSSLGKLKDHHLQKKEYQSVFFSFRFFFLFLNIFIIGARYIAEIIGDRAKPWSTPILVLNNREEKLFYEYIVEQLK